MKKLGLIGALSAVALFFYFQNSIQKESELIEPSFEIPEMEEGKNPEPYDHWYNIRSYPNGFDQEISKNRYK